MNCQVIVGNIGTVHESNNLELATRDYYEYKALSQQDAGRASGETVVLFVDGEIIKEYIGTNDIESED